MSLTTRSLASPRLPLDEGDRVVAIQNRNVLNGAEVRGAYVHDLERWRTELDAIQELGARRTIARNMTLPDGRIESVRVAEMTASGFRVARVPPLLGRYLVDEDERVDAAPVVIIGYRLWQSRFGGDPEILGKALQLGATRHAIVGVMPEGFAFPVNNRLWTPLRLDPLAVGSPSGALARYLHD